MILLRPQWLTAAILLSAFPVMIYQQGVMFVAVHHAGAASYYAASAADPFFPLLYLVIFITLSRGAAALSWINCAGFYLQFLLNVTLLSDPAPSPERIGAEHFLMQAMMAHPIYVIALGYIVNLRERLYATRQEAFESKESFLAMLSHEIRNLMQTMVGAIELLDLRLKEPNERKNVVRLQKAAIQLQTYLSDVNELTKLENPAMQAQKSRFDLAQLLADIRDEWLPQAESRGLQLTLRIREGEGGQPMFVDSDVARLRQIVSNLVSNALKYTEAGSVTIAAGDSAALPGCAVVEVVDTGIGMDEKYLGRIFQPYVRLENPGKRATEGSGLGLTIVERLVASIGGSLQVESRLNHGTRFEVTVPGLAAQ